MWLEICTDSEEDWAEVLRMCGESFETSAPYIMNSMSYDKRRRFMEEYFKYIYETELSRGRAGLVCVKTRKNDGGIVIVYTACGSYNRQIPAAGRKSAMEAIDVDATKEIFKEHFCVERKIHAKIREASRKLEFCYLYGVFAFCHPDYRRSGVGKKFQKQAADILFQEGIRRGYFDKRKPCIDYAIIDDMEARKFSQKLGLIEFAHVHTSESPACVEHTYSTKENFFDCVFAYGSEMLNASGLGEQITQIFKMPYPRL